MGIHFDEKKQTFSIDTANSTYQFQVDRHGFLLHLYYGKKISGNADYLLKYLDRGFSGNPACLINDRTFSMDVLPQELPVWGSGDFRSPAFVVEKEDGTRSVDLKYVTYQIRKGKYSLPGLPAVYVSDEEATEAETLEIVLEDSVLSLEVDLLYGVLPKLDIITRAIQIKNKGVDTVYLDKLMPASLDFITGDYDLITFHGRHTMERLMQRVPINHLSQRIGSRRGASSHQFNPMLIAAKPETTDSFGDCYAMEFVYSGGFQAEALKDQFGTTRVQMGLQEEGFHYPVAFGETFTSPEVILSFSRDGFDRLSHNLHDVIRQHICRGAYQYQPRPVLVNSWEGSLCNITRDSLLSLAREGKEIGLDMLVVDDGWFGNRDDDNTSLGDWYANEEKLGGSLAQLITDVNRIGLKFGIWMEPEMISEKSHLYEMHPDWALQIPGRIPIRGRNQLVLDFSRKDVRDYIYDRICDILDSGNIEYLKWDYNRSIYDVYSEGVTHQGRVLYDYMLGLYEVLEKLVNRYPHVLIEGCSGGGGRYDAGMLYYTPQIWTSDNTDPIDRMLIQYGTSFGYPASTMAAHVSKSPNEQTGRVTPIQTRVIAAMYGSFGFELDLSLLTKEEKKAAGEEVKKYHRLERLITDGRYYRLSDPAKDKFCAWSFVSRDGAEALVNAVVLKLQSNDELFYVRPKGLKPERVYKEINTGECYDSDLLMSAGLPLPKESGEHRAYQFHFILQQ
ncbi:MAG: alpha-galactosidase [Eubacterium sp.]|nr:alpha-galactosidase [Eubacterium sp.]